MERVRFSKDGSQLQLTAVDGRRALVVLPNDPELVDILARNGVDISGALLWGLVHPPAEWWGASGVEWPAPVRERYTRLWSGCTFLRAQNLPVEWLHRCSCRGAACMGRVPHCELRQIGRCAHEAAIGARLTRPAALPALPGRSERGRAAGQLCGAAGQPALPPHRLCRPLPALPPRRRRLGERTLLVLGQLVLSALLLLVLVSRAASVSVPAWNAIKRLLGLRVLGASLHVGAGRIVACLGVCVEVCTLRCRPCPMGGPPASPSRSPTSAPAVPSLLTRQGGGMGPMGGPMDFGRSKSKFQEIPETGVMFDQVR